MDEVNKIILSPKSLPADFNCCFPLNCSISSFRKWLHLQNVETINGKSHKDNFYHTLEVLDNVAEKSDDLWLRWAAIMHDIAKPPTKRFDPEQGWTFHGHEELGARWTPRIFTRLKLPLDHKMKYVQKLVKLHLRPIALVKGHVTDSAIRRLLSEAGDDIEDLMILCNADITSKNEFKVKNIRRTSRRSTENLKAVEEKDRIRNFQPPVSGLLIMKTFGLGPCHHIGNIKSRIKEAILKEKSRMNMLLQ
jgi:poly(A) polymerase